MKAMHIHEHTKEKLNWSTDGAVIDADVHTHCPPTDLYFPTFYHLDIYLYVSLDLYIRTNKKFTGYRYPLCTFQII